ncbi:MAG: hypothetical protein H6736_19650 [Alphaproteobacteria bacterium]|nr:hypothetical protein [Alphaproteobacteria bacterium]MCB9694028.1 hypothetical protein [Alphaproteobacteria bacterium]
MSQLGAQIDDIHNRYRNRFAGFPRITRDTEELEGILAELKKLDSKKLDADEKERVKANTELYTSELENIRTAQSEGPAALLTHRLSTWANFVQARYSRYFAGQERRSRDLGILAEMIEDADKLLSEMQQLAAKGTTPALQEAITLTEGNLKVYRVERERIREERKKVFGAERGTQFAQLANSQFNRYRLHFANKHRVSRNPRALEHIIEALQEILDGMEALLADGFNTEVHKKNIDLVRSNLGVYKAELINVRTAQREASLTDRVGFLGAAANDVFKVYRENFAGQSRSSRDIGLLEDQMELLLQVGKMMDAIDRTEEDDTNERNLALVMDMLYLYHREHAEVAKLKKS